MWERFRLPGKSTIEEALPPKGWMNQIARVGGHGAPKQTLFLAWRGKANGMRTNI